MPADDPISALEVLDASDERQRSPISRFSKPFLEIVKMLAPPGAEFALGGLEIALDWLKGRAESSRQEFVSVFAAEIKWCGANIQKLIADNEAQRRFVEGELPGLTVDALRRAEQCRAKERIARLARILSHAAEVGARDGADSIEDMMAIATGLSERDVLILSHATIEYHVEVSTHAQEAQRAVAERAWRRIPGKAKCTISEDELVTTGSRLESFGLVTRVETGQPWQPSVFRPLEFGDKFIEYIRSASRQ
ncbi:MAG TPA: hypothetical protein VH325_07725 [Bryobacteraceae bacterium]|nr:hypothetical protein [Bryobacteraceae bacterium]